MVEQRYMFMNVSILVNYVECKTSCVFTSFFIITLDVPEAQSNTPSPANEPSEEAAVENVSAVKQCPLKTESNNSSPGEENFLLY